MDSGSDNHGGGGGGLILSAPDSHYCTSFGTMDSGSDNLGGGGGGGGNYTHGA